MTEKRGRVALLDMEIDREALKRDETRTAVLGGQFRVAFLRWKRAQWYRERREARA